MEAVGNGGGCGGVGGWKLWVKMGVVGSGGGWGVVVGRMWWGWRLEVVVGGGFWWGRVLW